MGVRKLKRRANSYTAWLTTVLSISSHVILCDPGQAVPQVIGDLELAAGATCHSIRQVISIRIHVNLVARRTANEHRGSSHHGAPRDALRVSSAREPRSTSVDARELRRDRRHDRADSTPRSIARLTSGWAHGVPREGSVADARFFRAITDGEGRDLRIYEIGDDGAQARVAVSVDGDAYVDFGTRSPRDPPPSSIAHVHAPEAYFVRITGLDDLGLDPGFDLDAVEAMR